MKHPPWTVLMAILLFPAPAFIAWQALKFPFVKNTLNQSTTLGHPHPSHVSDPSERPVSGERRRLPE